MQIRASRSSRADRVTTSCGECRRRKQKCNQGQPCSNCARRYPQPLCEYKPHPKKEATPGPGHAPTFSVSLDPLTDDDDALPGTREPLLPVQRTASLSSSWTGLHQREPASPGAGDLIRWSGVNILTRLPGSDARDRLWTNPWNNAPGSLSPGNIPECEPDCRLHSDSIHDALHLLRTRYSVPNGYFDCHPVGSDDFMKWVKALNPGVIGHISPSDGSLQDLRHLPLVASRQNGELLRIYVKLISRFKACIDGMPDPSNQYYRNYVPYSIQTPLLAQIAIYTASCFLNETGHIDKTVTMYHKGQAIHMLNERLRQDVSSTSDESIAGIIQLILDEWYWGETNDLRAHLRGLREMIRLRGGLRNLGMNGLLSKLAITADTCIALSFEVNSFLQGPAFEFQDHSPGLLRLTHNTPLAPGLVPFSTCAEALELHPVTAAILDDVRFLITTVLSLPPYPTAQDLQKVRTTSTWVHERINDLPVASPLSRCPSESRSDNSPAAEGTPAESPSSSAGGNASQQSAAEAGPGAQEAQETQKKQKSPSPDTQPQDFLYQSVRMAALTYTRAIMERRPFSATVAPSGFLALWTRMWRVPMGRWRRVAGVFLWIMAALAPCTRETPHDRFVKSLLTIGAMQMAVESWEVTAAALRGAMSLQRWLRAEEEAPPVSVPVPVPASVPLGLPSRTHQGEGGGSEAAARVQKPARAKTRGAKARRRGEEGEGPVRAAMDGQAAGPPVSERVVGGAKQLAERGSVLAGWQK